jgi:predicted phage-related endonuclease
LKVKQDNKIRIHEDHEFLTTNLDGMVVGEKVPVEYKTTAQPWDGEIPDHYFVQIQHQMMVTESPYIYFASLSLGFNKQFVIEKYERNEEFISDMEKKLIDFWENHVLKSVPPEPQSVEDAQKIFREVDPDSIRDADESIYYICRKLQNLNGDKKAIDDRIKEHKLELMKSLSNKQLLQYNGTTLVTWKQTKDRSIFDKDQFREDHPKLFNKYTKTRVGSRRFVLKKIEEI